MQRFETRFASGLSPVLRSLKDRSAIEILGGPAAHPFQPRQDPALTGFQLEVGLDDHQLRLGQRPQGIWAPECAYVPGLEQIYKQVGVRRFMVDGPTVHGVTSHAYDVAGSGVIAFPRDLEVTYRVWSPRAGYPGSGPYRDFHTYDHPSGLRPSRVTSKTTEPHLKKPYDPQLARAQADADAHDFVDRVRDRLIETADETGRPALVVAGYDTELFGHWWHEGPYWLEQVLRMLPDAGVRVTTLGNAVEHVDVVEAELPAGSWGWGKDFRVWDSPLVADIAAKDAEVGEQLIKAVRKHGTPTRNDALDQLARETMLAMQSDWAFMVNGDSAADYARGRLHHHADRARRLATAIEVEDWERAHALATSLRTTANPFGHLDARLLAAWSESCGS
jgi:1,4-alpha-glucan branching enzyme